MPLRFDHSGRWKLDLAVWRAGFVCALLGSAFSAEVPSGANASATLTNVQQILDAGLEGARSSSQTARFRAVITYPSLDVRNRIYVQDDTAGVQVAAASLDFRPEPGQFVEVEGITAPGPYYPFVRQARVRFLGDVPLPKPKQSSAARLAAGADFAQWVSLRATIYDLAIRKGRLLLHVASDEHLFATFVTITPGQVLPADWRDAEVELHGIPWIFYGERNIPTGFRFHVPGTNSIRFLHRGASNVFTRPLRTVRELRENPAGSEGRVRIAGVVTQFSMGGGFTLQDETGSLRAQRLNTILPDAHDGRYLERPAQTNLRSGDRIELVGAPSAQSASAPLLLHAEYRVTGHAPAPAAREVSAAMVRTGEYDAALVRLTGRLVDRTTRRTGGIVDQSLWLQDGNALFEAVLQTEDLVPLPGENDRLLQVTGSCELQPGDQSRTRPFRVHLRDASDVRVLRAVPVLNSAVLKLLGGAGGVVAMALCWIWLLRRQVAQQTAAARASEERTRLIVDTALDAVITMDAAGFICGWNPQAERTFGWSSEEAIGRHLDQAIIPQSASQTQPGRWQELFGGKSDRSNHRMEVIASHRNGRQFPIELAMTRLRAGDSWIFSAFARDITEQKRSEAELLKNLAREKELGEMKTGFVSLVSHEFRTPLGVIMSATEILQRYFDRLHADKRARHLEMIFRSSRNLASLIEEVLVLGAVEEGRMEFKPAPVAVETICRALVDEITSATNAVCPVHLCVASSFEGAVSDEGLLRHILTNLLSNAVKYSEPGSPVEFKLERQDSYGVFVVQDHGIGIQPEDKEHLFAAFTRGRNVGARPGTGLGLVIVQRCVELHGGELNLESEVGQGTTVTVRLPLFRPSVPVRAPADADSI